MNFQEKIQISIQCVHLREVFVAFANEVFKENISVPNYNHFEELISSKIEELNGAFKPVLFTWLTPAEIDEAVVDLEHSPLPNTKDIDDPPTNVELFKYPTVEYDYFAKRKEVMAKIAAVNYKSFLERKKRMTKKRAKTSVRKLFFECFQK